MNQRVMGAQNAQQQYQYGVEIMQKAIKNSEEWHEEFMEAANVFKAHQEKSTAEIQALQDDLRNIEQHLARPRETPDQRSSSGQLAGEIVQTLRTSPHFASLEQSGKGAAGALIQGRQVLSALGNGGRGGSGMGGIPSDAERTGIFHEVAAQPGLLQLLPTRKTDRDAIEFVRLVATGDAAVQAKEGDTKAEIELDGALARAEICTVAAHCTASRQALGDHAQLGNVIDSLLALRLVRQVERQVLYGSGIDGQIEGLMTLSNPFVPAAPANAAERIGQAIVGMTADGFSPDLIVCHPLDWYGITTLKDAQNSYLMGSPASPIVPSLWNRVVAQSALMAAGTVLVLDTSHITLLDRQQLQILVSEHHADNFTRNQVTLLGEVRVGLEVRHTGAARTVALT